MEPCYTLAPLSRRGWRSAETADLPNATPDHLIPLFTATPQGCRQIGGNQKTLVYAIRDQKAEVRRQGEKAEVRGLLISDA